ncbi:MAG: tRNA lysidine(34) synthetase TilS [Thermodesulfobacteria bacterium]|nr:tRNA lysidine(34) synthetase TilS [Thermodesulfobacteriota bacterium]
MLLRKVKNYIQKYELFQHGERVLLAVSGGVDSMVLLEVMEEVAKDYRLKLFVSHFDHKLRKNSIEDAIFVYNTCKKKRIPCFLSAAPVAEYAKREGLSLEMAGRELRYTLWNRLCAKYDLQKVVLAHHLDDLAEEIFMRLIKGTGKRGLAGIPIKREGRIVRPLLFVTKDEIISFAKQRGISWREDYTNKDLRFFRNKIRHILIPFLEEKFNKNLKNSLKKTALIIAEEEELIEELAREKFREIAFSYEGELALKFYELKKLHPVLRKRIYFIAFKQAGVPLFRIGFSHIEAIETLVVSRARGPVYLPGDFKVYRGPGYITITKKVFALPYFELTVSEEGTYELPTGQVLRVYKKRITQDMITPLNSMTFSAEVLDFPFIIRRRKPGDRIFYEKVGHKKLKKFFMEQEVPAFLRDRVLIVEHKGKIIGVWGLYIHPEYKVKEDTKEVVVLQLGETYGERIS